MKPLYTKEQFSDAKTKDKLPCECYICKDTFYTQKKTINDVLKKRNYSVGKYCSSKCHSIGITKKQKLNCVQCNKEFLKTPFEMKKSKSGNHFCSRSCASVYRNAHKTTGTRRSKLEVWLESKLITLYPEQKILFNDVKTINAELDIYFPNLKLAFELNGIFHYEPIFGQIKLDKTKNNDNRKFQACIERGIELCIIDTSSQKYFKEHICQKYLDIIVDIISKKLIYK